MTMWTVELQGEQLQESFGGYLAGLCAPPCTLFLQGDLGTGKTTLVRGFLRGLGYRGKVKSPTYTLLEPYELPDCVCYHFDQYRLADPEELEYLGLSDLLESRAILLVEWPERGGDRLPPADLELRLEHAGEARRLSLSGLSEAGRALERQLQATDRESILSQRLGDSG
jgi:tRNA threonylcarbamoyladenosine biosynthesis protein TsaE